LLVSKQGTQSAFPTYSWHVHPANQRITLGLNLSEFSHTMHHKGREKGNLFDITEKKGKEEISRDARTFWGVGRRVVKIYLISLKNFHLS
jgi:hypothetical protein